MRNPLVFQGAQSEEETAHMLSLDEQALDQLDYAFHLLCQKKELQLGLVVTAAKMAQSYTTDPAIVFALRELGLSLTTQQQQRLLAEGVNIRR